MTAIHESDLIVDAKEFFNEKVHEATDSLQFEFSDDVKLYLGDLLFKFINPKTISDMLGDDSVLDSSLFEILKRAEETEAIYERIQFLKCLGDISLYVSGFFQDYFNRKLFDVGYYIDMGAMAYAGAASLSGQSTENGVVVPLDQLGADFGKAVDVVAEVAQRTQAASQSSQDVLALYDRWNRSKSTRLMRILMDAGINPIHVPTKLAQ